VEACPEIKAAAEGINEHLAAVAVAWSELVNWMCSLDFRLVKAGMVYITI